MIPIKLTLRNFMSYGEENTTLDFSGMHLVCLSGDNGNGKSALLDAMTYALWGKTRASGSQASSEDDLVRLGGEEMEIAFEFQLGDNRYRVLRRRSRRARVGEWQAQVYEPGGGWRPIGGSGVRETERQLTRLLRMEYETFLNSAYIQQGRADEFTRQRPDARKRILADILDLRRYDRLEQMAKERRNECELALRDLEGEIRHLEARAAEAETYRERLREQEAALKEWTTERAKREAKLNLLRAQQSTLDVKAQRLQEREEKLREVEQEVREMEAQAVRLRAKIEWDAALIAQKPAILADFARLQEMRAKAERLETEVAALHQAQNAHTKVQGQLEAQRHELQRQKDRAESEWARVEERNRLIADLEAKLQDLAPKLTLFEQARQERERIRTALKEAQEAFNDLAARSKQLKSELTEIEEVLEMLAQPKSLCPVCQSDLSGGRQAVVLQRQQQKRAALRDLLAEVNREGANRKREREALQAQADALEERLRSETALRAHQRIWQESLEEARAQNAAAPEVETRLDELRRRVEAEDYGHKERAELRRLEREMERLQVAAAEQARAQAVVRELTEQQAERRHAQLEEAERSYAQDRAEAERLEQKRRRRCEQIAAERARQEAMRAELSDHETVRRSVAAADQAVREAVEACETARAQVESFRRALEDCARALEQARQKQIERDRLAKDKQAYSELAAAFGKKGVQALIIDNALPEIEEEANRLLARMTDNGMRIALSTLRAARTGSQSIETLDIQITDDAGTRPYEMFSGGEAFRINFALRIALSRLLARRAGAQLQTLIIDEGFGTQDAKGRERLVEAIEAIKEEFALILVISHVEELKDAFPTRIEVLKTPNGSRIHYLE